MDDLLSEFLTETAESMETLDTELVLLEKDPNNEDILGKVFRLVHTIKGTCGFLGLPRLEAIAHAAEDVLGKFRDQVLVVTGESVSLILTSLDCIRSILEALEHTGVEPEGDDSALIARLTHLAKTGDVVQGESPPQEVMEEVSVLEEEATEVEEEATEDEAVALPVSAHTHNMTVQQNPSQQEEGPQPMHREGAGQQTIRVNVDLLENLMTMVSELVLTRNQLLQILRETGESEFAVSLQRLSHVTTELQGGVMKTRMQPIGNAWAKLPRIVRDLSVELGKDIDLQMIGAETELDRQVLEIIKDPLTHMVRNSADHGIELPEERIRHGKPKTGTITLNAYHEGGHIHIEISDDGHGMNVDRIREKVLERGLATAEELATMTTHQICQFIFQPGFSTAQAVTSVSGRGVGMDVVKTNIDRIGGNVDLKVFPGQGSTFLIKIPLTLAIVSALIVECEGERFAVPQINVIELVRTGQGSDYMVESLQGTSILRLRDALLPLVTLHDLLGISDYDEDKSRIVVVCQNGDMTYGMVVDQVFDSEEIVVKPVSPLLRSVDIFSGNTIMGDGSVIMILDLNGIARRVSLVNVQKATSMQEEKEDLEDNRIALLLFRAGNNIPKAVPLALVARLEEVDFEKVEYTGTRAMIQYRGFLMPLLGVSPDYVFPESGKFPTLVFTDRGKSMGLVVDEILDIVEEVVSIELHVGTDGVVGSAIINDKATEVLDASYYLTQAFSDWFSSTSSASDTESPSKLSLLLVDDSAFFTNLMSPILVSYGFDVLAVSNARDALQILEEGQKCDVVVSDIEMPGMDGFEFCETLRQHKELSNMPFIALSSYATQNDIAHGHEVGFTDYVTKNDRKRLLSALGALAA